MKIGVLGMALGAIGLAMTPKAAEQEAVVNRAVHDLISKECLSCHSQGGIGGIRLDSSERIVFHHKLIRRQLLTQAMPPHLYESDIQFGGHARQLTDQDRLLIQKWNKAEKVPFQVRPDASKIAALASVKLASPELLPAIGDEQRRAFSVPLRSEQLSLGGIEVEAEAAHSLRFSTFAIVPAELKDRALDVAQTSGTFYGIQPVVSGRVAQGSALPNWGQWGNVRLPSGSYLVIVNQFKPTGKPESDAVTVRFLESSQSDDSLKNIQIENPDFEIKPKTNLELSLSHVFESDQTLISLLPEARYYCEEVEIKLESPTGKTLRLYHTRRWNFSFPPGLQLNQPLRVARGSVLRARFVYRNDERCPMNQGREPGLIQSGSGPEDEVCRLGLLIR